ncbi:MAG: hypothetical protein A2X12_09010 [Bacteroidetes bacterium GWE2_29_8]|nr:MAG: hypothetical protein A2X12_09010 [Bacteroidetes bacterium GWE2_29_8]OFY18508.1 MAG: hypothetical protein A2X02_07805 [Bacteroidetes bacterium GWF2_29_10]
MRGINVSGHKSINMGTLKRMYSELGLQNIKTYIQSGNIIFLFSYYKCTKSFNTNNYLFITISYCFFYFYPATVLQLLTFSTNPNINVMYKKTINDIKFSNLALFY